MVPAMSAPLRDSGGSEADPGGGETEIDGRRLRLTNLGKVMYPTSGFSKGDMLDYYGEVADIALGHLEGRPLTMKRFLDGVTGAYFFQKECPDHRPSSGGPA
jgi:bifunctional non-homologous end joining protein LigD